MTGMMPKRQVVAERREHRVAVHLGHDDVEEDHIDRRLVRVAQPLERLHAIADLDRLVADALQESGEQLAVEGGVVDDEDPARPDRATSGGWHHVGPPAAVGVVGCGAADGRRSSPEHSNRRRGLSYIQAP